MTTPTQRTLAWCRDKGWLADVAERWVNSASVNQLISSARMGMGWPRGKVVSNSGVRRDLFGFIDVIALKPGQILAIQATSSGNSSARLAKISSECSQQAAAWLRAGGAIEVWGWHKYASSREVEMFDEATSGTIVRRRSWRPRISSVLAADLDMPF